MEPLYQLLSCFGLGICGGLVAGLGIRYAIARRCFRIETTLGDHQKVLLSLKGADYSAARWKKKDQEQLELEQLARTPQPAKRKFDNDFMVGGPYGDPG